MREAKKGRKTREIGRDPPLEHPRTVTRVRTRRRTKRRKRNPARMRIARTVISHRLDHCVPGRCPIPSEL